MRMMVMTIMVVMRRMGIVMETATAALWLELVLMLMTTRPMMMIRRMRMELR